MKLQMNSQNRAIAAVVVLAVLGFVFWTMLLGPKREEAKKLGAQVEGLKASLAQHQAEVAEGEAARDEFPSEYQKLVVLGKAVPGDDDVASLLVQVNRISDGAGGTFREFKLAPAAGAGRRDRPGRACGDAVHHHVRWQLLRDRRLHQGPRLAGQDQRGRGEGG